MWSLSTRSSSLSWMWIMLRKLLQEGVKESKKVNDNMVTKNFPVDDHVKKAVLLAALQKTKKIKEK